VVPIDYCDAYLEYIESDAIKHIINQIYSLSNEIEKPEQSQRPYEVTYQEMVQKIDGMIKKI